MVAIVFHEVSHGWSALMLGDPTAKEARRLSLNPIRHVDPVGTVALPGAMALIGGPDWRTTVTIAAALALVSAGLIGGVAQILITSAYRHAEAGLLAPFDYASMLFALAIGYVVFGDVPTASMLAGACLVIASGVAIIWRERQLGLKRGRARSGMTPQG